MKKKRLNRQFNILLVLFLIFNNLLTPLANNVENNNTTENEKIVDNVDIDVGNDESIVSEEKNEETEEETVSDFDVEKNDVIEKNELSGSSEEKETEIEDSEKISSDIEEKNEKQIAEEENEIKNNEEKESEEDKKNESFDEDLEKNIESDKKEIDETKIEKEEIINEDDKKDQETNNETTTDSINSENETKNKKNIEETEDVPEEETYEISSKSEIIDEVYNISSVSVAQEEQEEQNVPYIDIDSLDSNIWTITENNLLLNENVDIKKPIMINRDVNVDFSNYTVSMSGNDFTFIIIDSDVVFSNGIIKAKNGDIDNKDGFDAISLINSNLTINDCKIYGGDGYSIKNIDETVGNGGVGIVARYENGDKKIIFNSGEIVGGIGGTGNVSNVQGMGGLGVVGKHISSKRKNNSVLSKITNGANGDIGCGNGGAGIVLLGDNINIENLEINSTGISGGNAGVEIKNTKRNLLKKRKTGVGLPEQYNSKELGYVTDGKHQGSSNTCSTFAFCSIAETYLLKNYSEDLKELGYEDPKDIDLSEYAEHFYIFISPDADDEGVPGRYVDNRLYDTSENKKYILDNFLDQPLYMIDHITLNSKRYGLIEEKYAPYNENKNLKNEDPSPLTKSIVKLKSAELLQYNGRDLNSYQEMLKTKIMENGSVILGLDPGFIVGNGTYRTINRINNTSGGIGHAIALIGWDDNFSKENFSTCRPEKDGAFIAKDSNDPNQLTYVSYEMNNGYWEAIACEFDIAKNIENVHFKDVGMSYETNGWMEFSNSLGYGVLHSLKNSFEILKGVTVMVPQNINNATVKIIDYYSSDQRVVSSKNVDLKTGLNYISFEGMIDYELAGSYLVTVDNIRNNSSFDIFIDCNDDEDKTKYSQRNYKYGTGGWELSDDECNYRIKLITEPCVTFHGAIGVFDNGFETMIKSVSEKPMSIPIPKLEGYEFSGYSDDRESGDLIITKEDIDSGKTYEFNEGKDFYAWYKVLYDITFDANGGSFGGETTKFMQYKNLDKMDNIPIPEREGCEFLGYSLTKGGEVAITKESEYEYHKYDTVYAVWKALIEYTATYNANGGSFTTGENGVRKYSVVDKSMNDMPIPERVGYKFLGYSEDSNSTTANITKESTYEFNEDKTFFAVWELIEYEYTATFNANGGSFTTGENGVRKYSVVNKSMSNMPIPERNGYKFLGYSEDSNSTTANITNSSSYDYNEDKTFFAVWELIEYTATFNSNSGSFADDENGIRIYSINNKSMSNMPIPERNGYKFLGYSEDSNSTTANITNSSSYDYNEDKTFFAVWELIEYTATFNSNNGSFSTGENGVRRYSINNKSLNDMPIPERVGYNFLGYSLEENGTVNITSSSTYDYNENKTFFAVWELIEYTATFNSNSGSFTTGENGVRKYSVVDKSMSNMPIPERNGYKFLGYSEDRNSTTANITNSSSYDYKEDKTFFAVWSKLYTVTFDSNTGKFGSDITKTIQYTNGSPMSNLPIPEKSGYSLLGYSVASDSTAAEITTSSSFTYNEDKYLYAIWKVVTNTTPTTKNNAGSRGRSTGGSGGSGGSLNNLNNNLFNKNVVENPIGQNPQPPVGVANRTALLDNSVNVEVKKTNWIFNVQTNKWNMSYENENNNVFAVNGMYKINDNTKVDDSHINEYCFDIYGNMVTGFVVDKDNKWYFMDDVVNDNLGRKVKGWRKYGENWYYFSKEGIMYQNTRTPDGYLINEKGVWDTTVAATTTTTTANNSSVSTSTVGPIVSTNQTDNKTNSNQVSSNTNGPGFGVIKNETKTNNLFGPGAMIEAIKKLGSTIIGLTKTSK